MLVSSEKRVEYARRILEIYSRVDDWIAVRFRGDLVVISLALEGEDSVGS